MSFALKYRPLTLDDMIGQDAAVKQVKGIFSKKDIPHSILVTGPTGCVDCDTEFMSPSGWVPISKYAGEKILQYNEDGTANFVKPIEYLKKKSDFFWHIKTKYGIDQCLSDEHRIVYLDKKSKKLKEAKAKNVVYTHNKSKFGFGGRFLTSFHLSSQNTKFCLSGALLRLQVAVMADGHFPRNTTRVVVRLKKERKKFRLEKLLEETNTNYDKRNCPSAEGFTVYKFYAPLRCKEFSEEFWSCSYEQLVDICDEVLHWDGNRGNLFFTNSKLSADFIQYAFAATGRRASINVSKRENRNIEYTIIIAKNSLTGISSTVKQNFVRYKSVDGYKYCFSVPSGMLVLRRQDNIFVTGNSGKTTLARIIARTANDLPTESTKLVDTTEIDGAEARGIDDVRQLIRASKFAPKKNYRIYILDEIHQWTAQAKQAFLKTLEEPPSRTLFILCTNEPEKLPDTVRGRCYQIRLSRVSLKNAGILLSRVCAKEGLEIPKGVLKQVVNLTRGHPRDALNALEAVSNYAAGGGDLEETEGVLSAVEQVVLVPPSDYLHKYLLSVYKGKYTMALRIASIVDNVDYFLTCLMEAHEQAIHALASEKLITPYTQGWANKVKEVSSSGDLGLMADMLDEMVKSTALVRERTVDPGRVLTALTARLVTMNNKYRISNK